MYISTIARDHVSKSSEKIIKNFEKHILKKNSARARFTRGKSGFAVYRGGVNRGFAVVSLGSALSCSFSIV